MLSENISTQHTDSINCVTSNSNLLLSGDDDSHICFTDLANRSPVGRLSHSDGEAITSVCFSPREDHTAFAATGTAVLHLDLRNGFTGEDCILNTFRINTEEVNSIAVDPSGGWIAAGDDSGEIQVISLKDSIPARAVYKTLRRGHSNICSAVVFRPSQQRSFELLSGGLDCRMVLWNYSRLRQLSSFDMNSSEGAAALGATATGQFCNPPMINALAVQHCNAQQQEEESQFPSLVAVARGDGCVALYNVDHNTKPGVAQKSSKKGNAVDKNEQSALCWAAGTENGGHTAAVNCVAFEKGSEGKRLFSVGNDRRFCVWEWQGGVAPPVAEHRHRSKINWVCSTGGGGVDAVLADVDGQLTAVTLSSG